MRLGLVTAIWKRPAITRIMLDYFSEFDLERVAVYSAEDDEAVTDVPGWIYTPHPNQPYSDKFNRGFQVLRGMVDAVMVVGSDDLVSKDYIEHAKSEMKSGVDYLQPGALWFYDASTRRCLYSVARRIGAGRVLSASLLDALGWHPYKAGLTSGLDQSMEERVHPMVTPRRIDLEDGRVLVDIKSEVNIWKFDDMAHLGKRNDDPVEFWHTHFPSVAEQVLALSPSHSDIASHGNTGARRSRLKAAQAAQRDTLGIGLKPDHEGRSAQLLHQEVCG